NVAPENLMTSKTCSRETVGKFSKNASMETPASRLFKSASTGTRVPRKTGVPPRISGSMVMGSEAISFSCITSDILKPLDRAAHCSFSFVMKQAKFCGYQPLIAVDSKYWQEYSAVPWRLAC